MYDPLTGLLARTTLKPQVELAITHAHTTGNEFALIVLDLDHFKSINDAFGHQRGDRVLSEFAQRAAEVSRARDVLIRYGGDEFVALLPESGSSQAMAFAGRLLDTIRSTSFTGEPPLTLTLSAGVATFPIDGTSFEELFAAADRRHYVAKYLGRATIIGDDLAAQPTHLVEAPSRLIERDHVMAVVQQFLDEQYAYTRPVLRMRGEPGTGHTRVLAEVRQAAAMRGVGALALQGTPALQGRVAGALSEMLHSTPLRVSASYDPHQLAVDLQYWLNNEGLDGLMITIDNAIYLDDATLDILRRLYDTPALERLALVIAEHEAPRLSVPNISFERDIRLAPLSPQGFRTWLRHSLRWEPPDEVINWFHTATGGLPARLWHALRYLLTNNLLTQTPAGWALARPLESIPLAELTDAHEHRPPHNLPRGLSQLVGRTNDLREIHHLVSQRRVIAIVGPGGLGKTRLALQAGAEQLEQFPDGVFFVNLAEATSHEWIMAQIAETVGLGTSNIDPIASTVAALRTRTLLLILDNCEHVNGLEAAVTLLIQHVHGLKIIITSRERPALAECTVLEIAGLDLPGTSKHDLSLYSSAVQLFVQRARHVQYAFEPDEHEQAAIVQICRLLDGMPLGIELAAAWVAGASCQQIAQMLSTNLRSLVAASPDLADRHQRIFAVIDTFWARLAPAERAMLRPLGLFRGGFDADAAQAVGHVSPFFLSSLVTSGYLRRTSSGRYEMHELLRQYALRQLQAAPRARREAEKRYAQYYTNRVQQSAGALLSGGENLAAFRIDLENIMATWNWAVRRGQIELLRVLGPAMARYWELVGLPHVGEPFLFNAIDCLRANLPALSSEDLALLSHLLCRVMWYQILRELYAPEALLDEATKYALESEFDDAVVETTLIQSWYQTRNDPVRTRTNLERALELGGSPSLNGECRRLLALTYYFTGQFERAGEHHERAVQQFIACGDRLGEMRATCNLAFLDMERLLYSSCDRRASRLLAQARAIGSTEMECMALAQLCHSALYRAALERASSYLERADQSARNNGDPVLQLYCLELRCMLADLGNRPERAVLCEKAFARFCDYKWNQGISSVGLMLGHLLLNEGALDRARETFLLAESALLSDGGRYAHGAQAGIASILFHQGHTAEALAQADDILRARATYSLDLLREPFGVLEYLVPILEASGDPRAAQVRQEARELFERRLLAIDDAAEHSHYRAIMSARWSVLRAAKPVPECYTVA